MPSAADKAVPRKIRKGITFEPEIWRDFEDLSKQLYSLPGTDQVRVLVTTWVNENRHLLTDDSRHNGAGPSARGDPEAS